MYTIIFLILVLLIAIFSSLLYFKDKKMRQKNLNDGICPRCQATFKIFTTSNGDNLKVDVIKSKILKNHNCSGACEVEYRCNSCDLKEVHII
jgi:uncharacterized membrane protein YvbJ